VVLADWVDLWVCDGGYFDGVQDALSGVALHLLHAAQAGVQGLSAHQLVGSISLSRHCPLWYGYSGNLKCLERLAYINTTIYPLTSLPLVAYCTLPAICLLTGKFIIPTVSTNLLLKLMCMQSAASFPLFDEVFEVFRV
jgi:hypothetical protein